MVALGAAGAALLVERALAPAAIALPLALGAALLVGLLGAPLAAGREPDEPPAPAERPPTPPPISQAAERPSPRAPPVERPVPHRGKDLDLTPLVDLSVRSALRQCALAIETLAELDPGGGRDAHDSNDFNGGTRALLSLAHGAAVRAQELMERARELADAGPSNGHAGGAAAAPLPVREESFTLREDIVVCARALGFELGREVALRFGSDFPAQATADRLLLRLMITALVHQVAEDRDDGAELLIEASHEDLVAPRVELRIAASATGAATIGELDLYDAANDANPRLQALSGLLGRLGGGRLYRGDGQIAMVLDVERFRRLTGTTLYGLGALEGCAVLVIDPRPIGRVTICEQLATWRLAPTGVPSLEDGLEAAAAAHRRGERFDVVLVAGFGDDQREVLCTLIDKLAQTAVPKVISLETVERALAPLVPAGAPSPPAAAVVRRLPRPPSPTDLIKQLVTLLAPQPDTSPAPERAANRLSVLVAEDNKVNQTLLMKMLERQGHSVRVVANGADLVDRLWESPDAYDVALVDIQMPVMDGYEATTVIRLREAQFKRKRIPIVAVTAHAMGGERERCLEAGMDGYLSKPVSDKELTAILESVRAAREPAPGPAGEGAADGAAGTTGGARTDEPFDRAHVLDIAAGDTEFLAGLVDIFADTAPKLVDEIAQHIAAGESDGVYRKAHQLKGSISNFGAERARSLAARIEELGVSGELDAAAALMGELRSRLDELVKGLEGLAHELAN